MFKGRKCIGLLWLIYCLTSSLANVAAQPLEASGHPRIINIYNFVRNSDFRLADSENILFEATEKQVALLKNANLPATWALQYDALINPRYQKLFKDQVGPENEIAAWWELPRPLVEKAGLKWRGRFDWDPAANVGFSPGYTPPERRKLVDTYMQEFKSVFGYYPRTVGSWYIDEITLAYLADKYGIVASCNCKDQIGTDGYTLWGGYWNQAYYPSRLNAYMPAQNRSGQIDVPIFRMLGSDPIYQHGTTPGLQSLEPVYPESGGSQKWVGWFMNNLIQEPSLAFGYAQAGQENSFGWAAMEKGLTNQIALIASLRQCGKVRVETLAQTGSWFRNRFYLTPPTSVVALDDWKDQGRKTIWYDSRFYRINFLWESNSFFIRDLHSFDQKLVSSAHDTALKATSLACETLPIMDWANWSGTSHEPVGIRPILMSPDGKSLPMQPQGSPIVTEASPTDLKIQQTLAGGETFSITCSEKTITFAGINSEKRPMPWALKLQGGEKLKSLVTAVKPDRICYHYVGMEYELRIVPGTGTCQKLPTGEIQITPEKSGKLTLTFLSRPGSSSEKP